MMNFIEIEVRSLDHERRVSEVERFGWMLQTGNPRITSGLIGRAFDALFATRSGEPALPSAAARRLSLTRSGSRL